MSLEPPVHPIHAGFSYQVITTAKTNVVILIILLQCPNCMQIPDFRFYVQRVIYMNKMEKQFEQKRCSFVVLVRDICHSLPMTSELMTPKKNPKTDYLLY